MSNLEISQELDQKDLTRLRVLECVRNEKEISRIDIATALKISPATVTSVSADLLSAGLVVEVRGDQESKSGIGKRGRPRTMLKLNADAHKIAGLKIARRAIYVLITDFEGEKLASYEHPLDTVTMSPDELAQYAYEAVKHACDKTDFTIEDISCVALGVPGQVNPNENYVHWSSSLTKRDVAMGQVLDRWFTCPVFVENDANLVAKAEHRFGEGRGFNTFIVVTIEHGVGLGIVLDGHLYSGHRGCGAELGHMKVQLNGALCQCGQRGCLEAYVGEYALMREVSVAGSAEKMSSVADITKSAKAGNPLAQSILERAGQMFGMGIGNLINLFDPERIILSGAQVDFDHLHSQHVMDSIKRSVVNESTPLPEICVHRWHEDMVTKGAAAYGIEQVSKIKIKQVVSDAA